MVVSSQIVVYWILFTVLSYFILLDLLKSVKNLLETIESKGVKDKLPSRVIRIQLDLSLIHI